MCSATPCRSRKYWRWRCLARACPRCQGCHCCCAIVIAAAAKPLLAAPLPPQPQGSSTTPCHCRCHRCWHWCCPPRACPHCQGCCCCCAIAIAATAKPLLAAPLPPCHKQVAQLPATAAAADAGASAAHQRACPCYQGCRCCCAIAATAKPLKHVGFECGTGVFSTNPSTDFSDGSTDFSDGMQKTAHD
jgi:hypothetical protein